jgi:hypothetical protein
VNDSMAAPTETGPPGAGVGDQRFVSDHRFPPRKWLNATLPLDGALKNHGGHDVRKKALIEQLIFTGFEIVNEWENWPNHDHYCVTAHVGWD